VAGYTGPGVRGWAGEITGENYIATGNGLVGKHVVEAIATGFLAEPGADLEHRLLLGIEAGRDAGGQGTREVHKPERSSALLVYSRHEHPDIDLRVDLHATAVEELRRVYVEYKKYEAYYRHAGSIRETPCLRKRFMATLQPAEA
jgi:uncharacterized Ntn-hydrolase superfamily protein